MRTVSPFLFAAVLGFAVQAGAAYPDTVLADHPAAYWRMDDLASGAVADSAGSHLDGKLVGNRVSAGDGPHAPEFPDLPAGNQSASFGGGASWIRISGPGASNPLRFAQNDTITVEAWVTCESLKDGQQVYIIGKGRTQNTGFAAHNQNWALRLRGQDGAAHASFLFRDARAPAGKGDENWHRWTTDVGFGLGRAWHHVAVTYTFGKPDSVRGYIDGEPSGGAWDMGGKSEEAPVVDDDEVWIGSSMGGSPNSSLRGSIDEVAVYRTALAPERIRQRFHKIESPAVTVAPSAPLPEGAVRVEILERVQKVAAETVLDQANAGGNDSTPSGGAIEAIDASWASVPDVKTDEYTQPAFAFSQVSTKYTERGVKADRSSPFMIRASGAVTLPPGEHRLLLRSLGGARLMMDGKKIVETKFITKRYADNEEVPDQESQMVVQGVRILPPGHNEAVVAVQGDGKPHVFILDAFVGGKKLRPEVGELSVSISSNGASFELFAPRATHVPLSDDGWTAYVKEQGKLLVQVDAQRRRNSKEDAYWAMRHDQARKTVAAKPAPAVPANPPGLPEGNAVDRFLNVKIQRAGAKPAPLTDDLAFLRRVTLDLAGVIPSPEEIRAFAADTSANRRARVIDRLLADPRWADAWVPYWQDVLAENPAILKATLNNSGPFRWWLHESFLDNKPMDRFVTELVSMEGSVYYGGPAGFAVATQNDVPTASKAQIISQAFMALEMKCARCHDAPYHAFNQEDLFNIAAMLQRDAIKVPITSSVPNISPSSHVTVTLKTGTSVQPHWPFGDFPSEPLPGVLRQQNDSRERLAAIITDPRNERFPQVLANRVWKRYFGWGLVEPVDDWETARPSHKELLQWLGRELVAHDYDLKHVARLILNSQAYQRVITPEGCLQRGADERLFESPARRRMTAEQIVDSLFVAAGKEFECEQLNFDGDGRRAIQEFNNLGTPHRAWEFAPLSNERDRPALALPKAQSILDVLSAYGWRESRPDPRSSRDHDPNVLQPATLANGIMGARITRISDDSAFAVMALKEQPVEALASQVVERVLSRKAKDEEIALITSALQQGYDGRVLPPDPNAAPRKRSQPRPVSWSNHLNAEATRIKLEAERDARAGDPPTPRLRAEWRERMEDVVWALMMSPEFVYLP